MQIIAIELHHQDFPPLSHLSWNFMKKKTIITTVMNKQRTRDGKNQGFVIKGINHTGQIFLTWPSVSSCVRHGCNPMERFSSEWGHLSEQCPPKFIDPRFRENKPKTLVFSH